MMSSVVDEVKPGRVTVAGKPSDDLAPGTLNSILKDASIFVKTSSAGTELSTSCD
jgi:hypothetical protein